MTKKVPEHDVHRERFRKFAHSVASQLAPDRVRFVYLYEEVQQRVMQALTKGNMTRTDTVLEVCSNRDLGGMNKTGSILVLGCTLVFH